MAEVLPFRALRYDPARTHLADVVTQPYDKITPAMQRAYYERHPANFIRFELPMPDGDPYLGARDFLRQARAAGLIRREERPAMYVYDQEFAHPAQKNVRCRRRALIALGLLHDYDEGAIFRHEQTLTGPKQDREQLLITTRVQSGLLFMLYEDPSQVVEQLQPRDDIPWFDDDLGVHQRLWPVTDAAAIAGLRQLLKPLPFFIADGHHRYETALAQRRSREGKYAEDFAMMALVNMHSAGLVVLPTHRAIFGLPADRFAAGIEKLRSELRARPMEAGADALGTELRGTSADHFVCAAAISGGAWFIDVPREELQRRFPGHSCELDVEALHAIFDEFFGISAADVTSQRNVRYHRHAEDALRDLNSGAQAAFIIRPVTVETIRDRSLRGALMPQKSTDFYPKMNSGLALYSWDESFAAPQGAAR